MEFKYDSVILSKIDVGETDRVYDIYTREAGKIRAKAIGVKKPNAKLAGNLEPVTHAEIFMARGRGRGNITGVIALDNFLGIKSDAAALQKVFYVFGIFRRLVTEEEKDEKIFDLISGYLEAIDKLCADAPKRNLRNERLDIITLGFLFKLLGALGYKIEAGICVKCGISLKPSNNYFSAEAGGIICGGCSGKIGRKIGISPDAIKLIRIFLKNKIGNFGKIEAGKNTINNLKIAVNEEINWITG